MQRVQTSCRVGLGGTWFYLDIFHETGTDCSLHEVLKFQEWKRAYRMETAISRSVHKSCEGEGGSIVKTSVASNGQNHAAELAGLRSNSLEFLVALAWRAVLLFLGWNEYQYQASYFCPVLLIAFTPSNSPPCCVPASLPFHSFLSFSYLPLLVFPLKKQWQQGSQPMERHKNVGRGEVNRQPVSKGN